MLVTDLIKAVKEGQEKFMSKPEQEPYWERVARIKEEMLRVSYEENKLLKKALAQPEQEPVAWRIRCTDPMRDWVLMYRYPKTEEQFSNMEIQSLYTTLPQRTWIGLTDEEREEIALEVPIDAVSITEAKLKQKNT